MTKRLLAAVLAIATIAYAQAGPSMSHTNGAIDGKQGESLSTLTDPGPLHADVTHYYTDEEGNVQEQGYGTHTYDAASGDFVRTTEVENPNHFQWMESRITYVYTNGHLTKIVWKRIVWTDLDWDGVMDPNEIDADLTRECSNPTVTAMPAVL